jgi:D-alanyl-D-alanine carboxypeptidase/D-alanyl-D-alanine-endopeptidase (penicillin-binding protein 4)
LKPLVDALWNSGVRRVDGGLIGDTSFLAAPPFGEGWAWDDLQYYYGAEVSALSVDDNVLDLELSPAGAVGDPCRIVAGAGGGLLSLVNRTRTTTPGSPRRIQIDRSSAGDEISVSGTLPLGDPEWIDSVAVASPARWFLGRFARDCAARGIQIAGPTRVVDDSGLAASEASLSNRVEIGSTKSPPLREIVRTMMLASQNLYAQLLFLQVGARRLSEADEKGGGEVTEFDALADPRRATELSARAAMVEFIRRAGIGTNAVFLEDGAGLSRGTLASAAATVQLLRFMDRHPAGAFFRGALPVAGVDGTLRNRMKETPAEGNVAAKTGTMRFISALSGYATSAGGEPFAFSVFLNHYRPRDGFNARDDVDRIAVLLAAFQENTPIED